jgi:hypothetical protein
VAWLAVGCQRLPVDCGWGERAPKNKHLKRVGIGFIFKFAQPLKTACHENHTKTDDDFWNTHASNFQFFLRGGL